MEVDRPYLVILSDSAEVFLAEIDSRRVFERVQGILLILEESPYTFPQYDPDYDADYPPISCRWCPVPDTFIGIYYGIDDEARVVEVYAILDQRSDPLMRFRGVEFN
jgi:hypothetical protein